MTGLVSTGHPDVSAAAADVLRAGGNAFDGIVAAGFASTVAEPLLCSLGGGGFALVHTATGEEVLFDFFTDTPGLGLPAEALTEEAAGAAGRAFDFDPVVIRFSGAEQVFHVGWASAAVPGMLKGLLHMHQRLGRIPLADVVAPAVALARDGVEVNDFQYQLSELLEPIIRYGAEGRSFYLTTRDDLIPVGSRFRNQPLASFLEGLPQAPDDLYTGELAAAIAQAMAEGGGLVTAQDLAHYAVIERSPLEVPYRGERLLTNPGPSLGGPLVALALSLQEVVDLAGCRWGSERHARTLLAVLDEVERIRARGGPLPAVGSDALAAAQEVVRVSTGGTTHMNVADSEGNVASLTASNGEGCGHFIAGTGIMLNNMMGEDDLHTDGFHQAPPGHRISSMMAPTMLVDDEGVFMALGTGGSKRIRTALQQAITNVVDFGLPAGEAVNRARMHITQGVLHVEPGFPDEAMAVLADHGAMNLWDDRNVYFGGVHAVVPRTGDGAGDGRRGGHFMVVDG